MKEKFEDNKLKWSVLYKTGTNKAKLNGILYVLKLESKHLR